jgi:hypothetical protein
MRIDSIAVTPRAGAITLEGVIGVVSARRAAAAALSAVTPPPEVVPEHTALVTVLSQLVAASDAFLADVADLDETEFGQAVNAATDLQALAERVANACNALDRRAADLQVDAAIRC